MSAALSVHDLHKRFGGAEVLRGVSLEMAQGEALAVIGPSGSGKSTLLRCIAGLERFDGGQIAVGGEPVRPLSGEVGFVFQGFNLFPHLTALQNVTLAPVHTGRLAAPEARQRGLELLEKVGLADQADAYPARMSGGQQQRCAIARALAMDPKVLLFDEPTSALDPELVAEVLDVIAGLAAEGRTLVIVTHQMAFAQGVASRTLFMDAGQAIEEGPSRELLAAPKTERLKRFLERVL